MEPMSIDWRGGAALSWPTAVELSASVILAPGLLLRELENAKLVLQRKVLSWPPVLRAQT
jgi:hypothetical protein